ncbi:site-specific integrase [Aliiroseovarius sp. F47248L]|uniref:site-specific integrase n=1 Tax=Aliiroseovarius sp. F47248L TaxID=2926420 RepID=UPI001FF1DDC8|nr:site-specific integrase [Aliiroseovarius sp. F47248L]MCK0139298.1 tyrosine-type recombinase/integrase [Aliiroseovarius sp. F47248L]
MPIKKRKAYRPRNERLRLSKALIDRMAPGSKDYFVKDSEITQLHLKVTPAGNKSFLVRYRNEAGQERKYKLGGYPTLNVAKARKQASEVLLAATLGDDPAESRSALRQGETIAQYGERFLTEFAELHLRPSTIYNYQLILRNTITPIFGAKKLSALTKPDVLNLQKSLQNTPYQANRVIGFLRRLYHYAEAQGDLAADSNPTKHVRAYKEHRRETLLSEDEMEQIGHSIDVLRKQNPTSGSAYDAIIFLFLTGCRTSEALRLKWEDVDFARDVLTFRNAKSGTRTHYINPELKGFLSGLPSFNRSEWVFPGRNNTTHRVDLKKPWAAIKEHAGLSGVRLHDIRHTVLTDVAAISDIQTAAMVGGHKSIRSTMRYIHGRSEVTREVMRQAASAKGALLLSNNKTEGESE